MELREGAPPSVEAAAVLRERSSPKRSKKDENSYDQQEKSGEVRSALINVLFLEGIRGFLLFGFRLGASTAPVKVFRSGFRFQGFIKLGSGVP